jgi:hypothetical protein
VLEVSNMPWREMHPYVLTRGAPIANGGYKFDFAKAFHVSPFLPMDMEYRCRLAPPGAWPLENWRQRCSTPPELRARGHRPVPWRGSWPRTCSPRCGSPR